MTLDQIQDHPASQSLSHPLWVEAPGRINLIGEHTDYNHGFVFPAAIDKKIYLGLSEHQSKDEVHIHAANLEEEAAFKAGEFDEGAASWVRHIQALIEVWLKKGYHMPSLRLVFGGNIPLGAGLSSSAAMGTGILFGMAKKWSLPLSRWEIARMAQAAEHRIGAHVGIMDQFAVLFGKKDRAMALDCLDYTFSYFPIALSDHQLVLINTKVSHSLAESAYNDRRAACEKVLQYLKEQNPSIKTLRDINLTELRVFKNMIDPKKYMRVENVMEENQRVQQAVRSLEKKDWEDFGNLLYQSHEGLSKKYEVSCQELDLLVSLAQKEEAVLGARMMGGGFGGCTLNLIKKEGSFTTIKNITKAYQDKTGIEAEVYPVQIGEGVNQVFPEKK